MESAATGTVTRRAQRGVAALELLVLAITSGVGTTAMVTGAGYLQQSARVHLMRDTAAKAGMLVESDRAGAVDLSLPAVGAARLFEGETDSVVTAHLRTDGTFTVTVADPSAPAWEAVYASAADPAAGIPKGLSTQRAGSVPAEAAAG